MKKLLVALCILPLAGCSMFNPVPQTKISGTIAGQKFELSNPKDTVITNLVVSVTTNGAAQLQVGYISSSQNVGAITGAYTGMADTVNAVANGINTAVQNGAALAAKTAGTAAAAAAK